MILIFRLPADFFCFHNGKNPYKFILHSEIKFHRATTAEICVIKTITFILSCMNYNASTTHNQCLSTRKHQKIEISYHLYSTSIESTYDLILSMHVCAQHKKARCRKQQTSKRASCRSEMCGRVVFSPHIAKKVNRFPRETAALNYNMFFKKYNCHSRLYDFLFTYRTIAHFLIQMAEL